MTNNLYKLLHACSYFDYGLDKISLIEATLQHDTTFNLTKAREELLNALADDTFDWVSLAIDTQLVYTSVEVPPEVDLFELSKVDWDKKVEHRVRYRNPFTLGFKRYQNLPK